MTCRTQAPPSCAPLAPMNAAQSPSTVPDGTRQVGRARAERHTHSRHLECRPQASLKKWPYLKQVPPSRTPPTPLNATQSPRTVPDGPRQVGGARAEWHTHSDVESAPSRPPSKHETQHASPPKPHAAGANERRTVAAYRA